MKKIWTLLFAASFSFGVISCGNQTQTQDSTEPAAQEAAPEEDEIPPVPTVPPGAKVFFSNLKDGATVSSPVHVQFGVEGMEVEPAGEANDGKGHHHIIINGSYLANGEIVPVNETNIHYGKGQTEDHLELQPGEYTLTMQFADGFHRSYGEQMSATIKVKVK